MKGKRARIPRFWGWKKRLVVTALPQGAARSALSNFPGPSIESHLPRAGPVRLRMLGGGYRRHLLELLLAPRVEVGEAGDHLHEMREDEGGGKMDLDAGTLVRSADELATRRTIGQTGSRSLVTGQ